MIVLYKPKITDLWFKEKLLSDPSTMSYNRRWGGTIAFPKEKWKSWSERWLSDDDKHFYRYLLNEEKREFVGEVAYHFDDERMICLADVLVMAKYRGNGCGKAGLKLLCQQAKRNGISELYDEIAIDNPAIVLFEKMGFVEVSRTEEAVLLRKKLQKV